MVWQFRYGLAPARLCVNKHFDVYACVNYCVADGGLESGFLAAGSFLSLTGARLKF
jgi:hypothetical protein